MRPSLRLAVAGIAVAALTVGVAAPANAQEARAQIFCILDDDGECPSDEVPPVPDEAPGPGRPVVVQPAFTG